MKKYLRLFGNINGDMLDELVEFCNNLSETDEAHLFITSAGGWSTAPKQMASIINNNENILDITFAWENSSASFKLLLEIIPEKRIILNSIFSGVHLQSRDVNTNDLLDIKNDKNTEILLSDMKEYNKQSIKLFKNIGLTKKEIKYIKKGSIVFLNYHRIMEALRLYEENKGNFRNDLSRL